MSKPVASGARFKGQKQEAEAYRKAALDAAYLCACAVNRVPPDESRVRNMDLAALYQAAKFHSLTAATAMALESAGVRDPAFSQAKNKAVRKAVLLDTEMRELFRRLDTAGVWYMPLKGSVLKDLYPALGMREMADCDILIDPARADGVRSIMEDLGFTAKCFGPGVHDVYHKEPVSSFEIHRVLFGPIHDQTLRSYYEKVSEKLIGPGCEKHFSPEDFYLYFIAHQYKHYSVRGTGLRTLLDNYVYLSKTPLNMEYVAAELKKMRLDGFEAAIRSLSLHLFRGETLTADDEERLDYILASGAYGTADHRVKNTMGKTGWNKFQYVWRRFFAPFYIRGKEQNPYAGMYPFFYRHKLLLPFLPFYRGFRAWTEGRLMPEIKAVVKQKKD